MKITNLAKIAGAVALTALLAGCIDMTEDILVTSSSTAKATITQTMGADIYGMVKAADAGGNSDKPFCKGTNDAYCLAPGNLPPGPPTVPAVQRGMFDFNWAVNVRKISDGTSNTIAMGECTWGPAWPVSSSPPTATIRSSLIATSPVTGGSPDPS